jgi:hypothetical protein
VSLESPVLLETVEQVLREGLALKDASLVIYRPGVLVEFKTELLQPALAATLEGRYRGWQIGAFEGHHCHLDLRSVSRVWFDAEPVSCQGGRLNYTVWFLTTGDCGNPYRREGLFSITLNAPYEKDGTPRVEVIEAVYSLCDRHRDRVGVSTSDAFVAARSRLGR